ncbi:hypothetical protein E1295_06925 [Nonomuraea mesophila]|uniref:Uncharacterized protein n=1 Tax=Nonomuraea mesophila TaxID=2530382 RepID=A0A4R5FVU5_9ACTN|nr:hypothetical protein [Nonomuraea mesophila]TDE58001.1 hypothetical protein E1295_06925 [Nonomuraea mesophila]
MPGSYGGPAPVGPGPHAAGPPAHPAAHGEPTPHAPGGPWSPAREDPAPQTWGPAPQAATPHDTGHDPGHDGGPNGGPDAEQTSTYSWFVPEGDSVPHTLGEPNPDQRR